MQYSFLKRLTLLASVVSGIGCMSLTVHAIVPFTLPTVPTIDPNILSGITFSGTSGGSGTWWYLTWLKLPPGFYLSWLTLSGITFSWATGSTGSWWTLTGIYFPPWFFSGLTLPTLTGSSTWGSITGSTSTGSSTWGSTMTGGGTPPPMGWLTPKPSLPFPDVTLFTKTVYCQTGWATIYNLTDPSLLPYYPQFNIEIGSSDWLSRARFLQIVLDFAGVDISSEITQIDTKYFPDVPVSAWYRTYVNYAARHGIISGNMDGNFYPDSKITRAEATKILIHALGKDGKPYMNTFVDVPEGHTLAIFIQAAYDYCFLNGKNTKDGKVIGGGGRIFGPSDSITGPETMKILYNMKY